MGVFPIIIGLDDISVSVHASVQGDKTGLIDGMNITAVISLDKSTVPTVPTEAIVTLQGKDYIFIEADLGCIVGSQPPIFSIRN